MRTKLKLVLVLASLGALGVLATGEHRVGRGRTRSFEAGDPMTANVPYVAWAGEEIRLVKCIDDPKGEWEGTSAEWAIVDSSVRQRSGDLRDPVFFDDTDRRTGDFAGAVEQAGRTCWAIDVDSVNPGMTRIKMAVDGNEGTPGSPILKHDFLVIWLSMSAPVLTELSDAAFPGYAVGDPLGDGNFSPIGTAPNAAFKAGLIRARVTGSFIDLHGAARTLPADWASLAGRYAFDTSGYNPSAWDIHDDDLATEGHTATSMCIARRREQSTPWTTASAATRSVGSRARSAARVAARARSGRSILHAPAPPTCRTASWTRATPRCLLHASTSTSPAPSAPWPRLTSTCSTAATGRVLPRRHTRSTRTTCTPRSTCRCFRATSPRRAWLATRRQASRVRSRTTSRATSPGS